jgi:membrane associated rhomboid family serine protease
MAHFNASMDKKAFFFPLGDENPCKCVPFINWILIGINVVVFLLSLSAFEFVIYTFGFTPAQFSILTMFTSMFLHGGFGHLFGNMWFLLIFGDNVEDKLGHVRYILFYMAAGLAASLTHFAIDPSSAIPAVGASGAISGVLGAYLVFYPRAGVYVSGGYGHVGKVPAFVMLGLWFLLQLIQGATSLLGAPSGIAFFAHIGGFVFGFIIGWLYRKTPSPFRK